MLYILDDIQFFLNETNSMTVSSVPFKNYVT